jgi:hypothetical protein
MSLSRGLKWFAACALLAACGGGGGGSSSDDDAGLTPGSGNDAATERPDGGGSGGSGGDGAGTGGMGASGSDAGGSGGTDGSGGHPGSGGSGGSGPACDADSCKAMSDECNVAACDKKSGECKLSPRKDGTACGNNKNNDCTAADSCQAGVCVARDATKGAPCGNHGDDCNYDDECDGHGKCIDKGVWKAGKACGDDTDTRCDAPDTCDAKGVCQKHYTAAKTPCGDQSQLCHNDDACDGKGKCKDNGGWVTGHCPDGVEMLDSGECVCGLRFVSDCHPFADVCDGVECKLGYAPAGTSCGDHVQTECDNPDSCDAHGQCKPNYVAEGMACTANGTGCRADECDGSGACADLGVISPCTISGTVSGQGVGLAGVLVELLVNGATSTSTDADGHFELSVPMNSETLLHIGDASGYWGVSELRTFVSHDAEQPLSFALASDVAATAAAGGVGLSVDTDDGALVVTISGTGLTGDEGATLSAASAMSIVHDGGSYAYSTTTMSVSGGSLYFYNIAPGTTSVSAVSASSNTCARPASSFPILPIFAHSLTNVAVTCE